MTLTRLTLSTFLATVAGREDRAVPQMLTGGWLHNPVTGELGRLNVGPAETGGRRIETDLWLQPGGAVARAHIHDHLYERFEVLEGEVAMQIGADTGTRRPGDGVAEVPPASCTTGGTRATGSPTCASRSKRRRPRRASRPPGSCR